MTTQDITILMNDEIQDRETTGDGKKAGKHRPL